MLRNDGLKIIVQGATELWTDLQHLPCLPGYETVLELLQVDLKAI